MYMCMAAMHLSLLFHLALLPASVCMYICMYVSIYSTVNMSPSNFILFKAAINVLIELVKRKESGEPFNYVHIYTR